MSLPINQIICGDCVEVLKTFPDECIDCCVTSPPYWGLRDYGVSGQLGLEKTPEEYVGKMVEVFREVNRVLKKEGTLWLNLGDTYSATRWTNKPGTGFQGEGSASNVRIEKDTKLPDKNLVGIPWRVAFALQSDGWYLRQDIIWHKPNPMPESVTDRCTKSHEYIFLLAKSQKYYFDNEAIKEMGNYSECFYRKKLRASANYKLKEPYKNNFPVPKDEFRNKRSVWTVTTKPFRGAHFATFPEDLIIPMIKAGCPVGGEVLDPFSGAGTTALVAKKLQRNYIGIDLNSKYCQMAEDRIEQECGSLF